MAELSPPGVLTGVVARVEVVDPVLTPRGEGFLFWHPPMSKERVVEVI